jgi:hypothetical protein
MSSDSTDKVRRYQVFRSDLVSKDLREYNQLAQMPHVVLASDYDALQAQYDALRKKLLAIANAKPSEWEPDVRDQFQLWAQNIARAATASQAMPASGEGQL